ncbi:MAG: MBL fold metallo-hydrolase [Gammaproteobacteria bacterium]|nr:MBL fold metallo-hydrolase [Gammaproteobacteria bacterium]
MISYTNNPTDSLPFGMLFIKGSWLSSNSVLLLGENSVLLDSGYFSHADSTVETLYSLLQDRPLDKVVNTHLHSDHCGGNAKIQEHWPNVQIIIPSGMVSLISTGNLHPQLYKPVGQNCPPFPFSDTLNAQSKPKWGDYDWQIYEAPGHDPHALVFFQPETKIVVTGDALWENGFGIVFPEFYGKSGFKETGETIDMIESLSPKLIIPGHGHITHDVSGSIFRARTKLAKYQANPDKHAMYAAKVLVKFKLLELGSISIQDLMSWADNSSLLHCINDQYFAKLPFTDFLNTIVNALISSNAASRKDHLVMSS